MNALLSFLYTLLAHDIRAALEAQGLDPQVGLPAPRPSGAARARTRHHGRIPRRACRSAGLVTLVNRGSIARRRLPHARRRWGHDGRHHAAAGSITAWQERKRDERRHPFLGESAPLGLFWHLQALLLKRYMRGDLDGYPPCLWR